MLAQSFRKTIPPFPKQVRSDSEIADAFWDRLYDGKLLERSLRIAAKDTYFLSAAAKTLLIVLGALTATKAVADDFASAENAGVVLIYAVIGVLVAMVAGLLAAFKWEERAASLTVLATQAAAAIRELESTWHEEVWAVQRGPDSKADPAKVIKDADSVLRDLELKAAELNVMAERPPEGQEEEALGPA